ncbi:hypothetical protein F5X99DRAFT_389032 [Biscogniauxia marginata]|nr:hypothetical protein F5X99DRAFT_389032 [Biscogniauxia marginata]
MVLSRVISCVVVMTCLPPILSNSSLPIWLTCSKKRPRLPRYQLTGTVSPFHHTMLQRTTCRYIFRSLVGRHAEEYHMLIYLCGARTHCLTIGRSVQMKHPENATMSGCVASHAANDNKRKELSTD